MRLLQNKTNVDAPDDDYPFGRARNNPGNRTGTPVDEELLGDILQFFEKMFNASGLVANEMPDNDYAGFQLYEALQTILTARATSGVYTPGLTNSLNVTSSDPEELQYLRVGNVVTVSGHFALVVTVNNTDSAVEIDLPIPSNFTSSRQAGGAGVYFGAGERSLVKIGADNATGKVRFEFETTAGAGNNRTISFSFTYLIVP